MKENECRKINTGFCTGCPALDLCERLTSHDVPHQEAIEYVGKTICPAGQKPEYKTFITSAGVVVYRAVEISTEL